MRTSESIKELAAAMVRVQAAMGPAVKGSVNPHFKSKYADLAAVWDACRIPLNSNGITVWQSVEGDAATVAILTRFVHVSGEWAEHGPLVIPLAKGTAHEVGSAISYGKRYALAAGVGVVAEEDDDGNAASKPNGNGHHEEKLTPPAPGIDGEILTTAAALLGLVGGKATIGSLIKDASAFEGKPDKDGVRSLVSFTDPATVTSEKWKKSTLTKLKDRLAKNVTADEELGQEEVPF
jgi:hypothetical protein